MREPTSSWPVRDAGPEAGRWLGQEVAFAGGGQGLVHAVLWDPHAPRIRSLVTDYTDGTGTPRRVAVPLDWVVHALPGPVVLGVGTSQLDQLPAEAAAPVAARPAPP